MCYGMGCDFENSQGECDKPRTELCPFSTRVKSLTYARNAAYERKVDEQIEKRVARADKESA